MTYENLDAKLINELSEDGRGSLRSLGERLDVSVTTVSNHLDDLTSSGAIEGFSPDIDYGQFGYDVTAVLQLNCEGSQMEEVSEWLGDHNQLLTVYETTGDTDLIAIGKFTDTDHMNDTVKELLAHDAILDTSTSVVLNTVAEDDTFDIPVEDE